jgi:adenine deaminase
LFHVEQKNVYNKKFMKITGKLVDVHKRDIYPAEIGIEKGRIKEISRKESAPERFILPGLIDSHIHIESSMITPGAFALAAVKQGTTGVVSDPHEIANVLGLAGIEYMIKDSEKVPVKFWFGASSCVPATGFETCGGRIGSIEIKQLLSKMNLKYLAEMMNFPGVIYDDNEVTEKIDIAKKLNKKIDGHAPGLSGEKLKKYISAGISTDHECSSIDEAREKIKLGMKVLIREGSAARNLEALKDLIKTEPEMIMLCSDDLHPEMLLRRHLNKLIAKLIVEGYNKYDVIRSCTVNPVLHYGLEAGLLRKGDSADFIVVDDINKMNVIETWIEGKKVFGEGEVLFKYGGNKSVNKWNSSEIKTDELVIKGTGGKLKVIEAFDGELFTKSISVETVEEEIYKPDPVSDILKVVVKDRYSDGPPAVGFIKGFGLKNGAFASSVAHDSHNIICIGANDKDIVSAVNEIVKMKGGLSVSNNAKTASLKLDIAGIMSSSSCEEVAAGYLNLSEQVKSLGCKLKAPFMSLSFMALLVMPELKIGDKGLFDGNKFCLTSIFEE